MRCLWISRYIPYPLDAGAKVYSARLAESLAEAGVFLRYLGFGDVNAAATQRRVDWVAVPGEKRRQVAALFSSLPVAAAIDATAAYSSLLEQQLQGDWDAIVLDGYGTGWALQRCRRYVAEHASRAPVLVHVSHNHEAALWRSMAQHGSGSLPKRLALWQNYRKVRSLERKVVRGVDLVTAITEQDADALAATGRNGRTVTLTPGHTGWVAAPRSIDAATARRVIIVGSFRWVMKQENLARFLDVADPVFRAHGIALDVVGDVPDALLATLRARCQATHFHGFVDDIAPYLGQARIAVVPELIGGGFKLKFLDYVFARVPVATLSRATDGLAPQLREQMLCSDDLQSLVAGIVANIDAIETLNGLQERAFTAAHALFRWEDRGQQLRQAIAALQHEHQAANGNVRRASKELGVSTV
ncbi:MAG TPA: glycosyltransferase family 4 protein [Steroidobacteraceae bacterium]|jgi:glycosyltransferase involved in cell wall biosynthesis